MRLVTADGNSVATYLHGGKIGVVVIYKGDSESSAKDIAMHVAASNPIVLRPEDVPADLIDKEKEIFVVRAKEEGTPEEQAKARSPRRQSRRQKWASWAACWAPPTMVIHDI